MLDSPLHIGSIASSAPAGTGNVMIEDVSALQTLIDILSRATDPGCEYCGGSGVKGRSLCEPCKGRGSLLATGPTPFQRF
jgi:DnaJ-class molecular chaperone